MLSQKPRLGDSRAARPPVQARQAMRDRRDRAVLGSQDRRVRGGEDARLAVSPRVTPVGRGQAEEERAVARLRELAHVEEVARELPL